MPLISLERLGVRTKIEGNRAFPASDHASDIILTIGAENERTGCEDSSEKRREKGAGG